jgi:TolB-like protein
MSEHTNPTNPKPPSVDRLSQFWQRVNDHKMVQWSVAYVALAYAVQHGVALTREAFEWPQAVERISMLLFVLGLPLVMTFAWYHGARASRQFTKAELSILTALLVIGSLLFYAFVRPSEEVAAGPKPAVQQASVAPGAANNAGISIAVLPFLNLSRDPDQEFFSDGMTEEINGALAKVADLHVVARTSAFQFKGQNQDVRAVGQALGASHLIEGSVRKVGDRVRIAAQLVRADNGLQLWSENYDRNLTDIFAVQEEIAQAIAASLRVPLGLKQGESLVPNRTANLDSYQDYLRARALVRTRAAPEPGGPLTQAAKLLEQTVAHDPDYAPAWALMGQAYGLIPALSSAYSSSSVEELRRIGEVSLSKAERAAQRAIRLDPTNADGYAALATVQAFRGKFIQAEELFKQALSLDPGNPEALQNYGTVLAAVGRLKDSLSLRQRLQALEPFVPVFNAFTAYILWLNGQNDVATAMLKSLPPNSVWRAYFLAEIYAASGRYGEAADALLTTPSGFLASGIVETAVRLLRTAPARAVARQSLPRLGQLSFAYLYVGAPERALEPVEDSLAAGFGNTPASSYVWHSSAAGLRKTERFKKFVRKAGLVDYWRERGWPDLCRPIGTDDFVCD